MCSFTGHETHIWPSFSHTVFPFVGNFWILVAGACFNTLIATFPEEFCCPFKGVFTCQGPFSSQMCYLPRLNTLLYHS